MYRGTNILKFRYIGSVDRDLHDVLDVDKVNPLIGSLCFRFERVFLGVCTLICQFPSYNNTINNKQLSIKGKKTFNKFHHKLESSL